MYDNIRCIATLDNIRCMHGLGDIEEHLLLLLLFTLHFTILP